MSLPMRLAKAMRQAALALAALAVGGPAAAFAQDQPVVFIHGLKGNSLSWSYGAGFLQNLNELTPITPDLGWKNAFATQAANLNTAVGYPGIVGIGHSNGGLAGRAHVQAYGPSSKINRLITVGTPHQGAAIIQAVRNGSVLNFYAGQIPLSIGNALGFYMSNDPTFDAGVTVTYLLRWVTSALQHLGYLFTYSSSLLELELGVPLADIFAPVANDMVPGSPFLTSLNAPANLVSEQSRLSLRTGLSTAIDPYEILMRGVLQASSTWITLRYLAQYGALALYNHYAVHPDPYLRVHAYLWMAVYDNLAQIDVKWHQVIGAYLGQQVVNGVNYIIVDRSDGLVPRSSALYPNGTNQIALAWPIHYIRHYWQPFSGAVLDQLSGELVVAGIPLRPTGGGDPPGGGGGDPPGGGCPPPLIVCE